MFLCKSNPYLIKCGRVSIVWEGRSIIIHIQYCYFFSVRSLTILITNDQVKTGLGIQLQHNKLYIQNEPFIVIKRVSLG